MIRAEALTVRYTRGLFRRSFTALDAVSLEIGEGEFFGLLGQNGAGKSTAMHCFVGLLRPSAGTLRVLGSVPEPGAKTFASVGYLPEEPRYHEYLTVEEAVTYYARLSGVRPSKARVDALLDQLGLAEHRRLTIRRCSKGMKQKVGIAQCVVHQPRLVFLDEPMRGLDPTTVRIFRDMLVEMHRAGATIIMSSHILAEVEMVATRVGIIHRGRLVADDRLATNRATKTDRYEIEVTSIAATAPYITDLRPSPSGMVGSLAATDFYPFMEYARANDVRVLNCSAARESLEARFMNIITAEGGRA